MRTTLYIFALFLASMPIPIASAREPVRAASVETRRRIMSIALDDGHNSLCLRRELERDWKPNPSRKLSDVRRAAIAKHCAPYTEMQRQLRAAFDIRYEDKPLFVAVPAIRIGHGGWETLHPWAFSSETRGLQTLDWYRRINDVRTPQDREYDCSTFGYSGQINPDPAPWEPIRKDPPPPKDDEPGDLPL